MKKLILVLVIFCQLGHATEKIVIIGDSLTEGYRLPSDKAYPALLQEKINQKKLDYKVINGGVSGSTTASGMSRLKWFLKAKPKILILALGANDGLRGIEVKTTKENLANIIRTAKKNKMDVILAGMKIPPNYGKQYTASFEKMYFDLVEEHEVGSIPFLLKGVAGKEKLNLEDGIHPNEKGYEIVAETVFEVLEQYL